MNLMVMFAAAVIVGLVIWAQIQKLSIKLDEMEANPDTSRYVKFCDIIDSELLRLKDMVKNEEILADESKEDEVLSRITSLSSELVFIQNMHSTNKNSKVWEEKLAEFLNKVDDLIDENFKNSDEISNKFRENLQKSFGEIK